MNPAAQVMSDYPRIYFACHTRHGRDSPSGNTLSAPSTMRITVDRLIRAGYVTCEPDLHDGRRVALRITKAGAELREKKAGAKSKNQT